MNSNWYCRKTAKKWYQVWFNPLSWFVGKLRYNWASGEAWRLANKQYQYFSDADNGYINGDVITISSVDDIASVANNGGVQKGDLLYFSSDGVNAYHATIVSKVENGMIYYAAHSQPRYDQPLEDSMETNTIFIVRINDNA